METIGLERLLPAVFAEQPPVGSDVWLRDVSLKKGERCLVEAASGTGKSSLCSFLYGYRVDYRGRILFDGQDARSLSVEGWSRLRRTSLSMLFQELRLFPELSVLENIRLKNQLTGFKPPGQIDSLLEEVGVAEKRDKPAGKLSYGQQQRVAFVRALCQPFDFILLDEPVSHLDDDNAAVLSRILLREAEGQGAGILVTSIGKRLQLPYDKTFTL